MEMTIAILDIITHQDPKTKIMIISTFLRANPFLFFLLTELEKNKSKPFKERLITLVFFPRPISIFDSTRISQLCPSPSSPAFSLRPPAAFLSPTRRQNPPELSVIAFIFFFLHLLIFYTNLLRQLQITLPHPTHGAWSLPFQRQFHPSWLIVEQ